MSPSATLHRHRPVVVLCASCCSPRAPGCRCARRNTSASLKADGALERVQTRYRFAKLHDAARGRTPSAPDVVTGMPARLGHFVGVRASRCGRSAHPAYVALGAMSSIGTSASTQFAPHAAPSRGRSSDHTPLLGPRATPRRFCLEATAALRCGHVHPAKDRLRIHDGVRTPRDHRLPTCFPAHEMTSLRMTANDATRRTDISARSRFCRRSAMSAMTKCRNLVTKPRKRRGARGRREEKRARPWRGGRATPGPGSARRRTPGRRPSAGPRLSASRQARGCRAASSSGRSPSPRPRCWDRWR